MSTLPSHLRLMLLLLGLLSSIWIAWHSLNDDAVSKPLPTLKKGKHYESIISGSVRTPLSERERLRSLTDPHQFYADLESYFLSQDSATFSPIQQKVHTCQQIFSQIDNGGATGMLYNADDRSRWCAQVAIYCRELQAFATAETFESLSALFAKMETEDLSQVKTWGDYLNHANQIGPLKKLMDQIDPYEDLMPPLVDFVFEHRAALLTPQEETHSEAPSL